ncbi:MAG TPA: iron-containing alcohol dehydrogenase [Gaiellales bacterium]|nr:iron-containing alcohol dehydrogenase [Gaiellales bacterium]
MIAPFRNHLPVKIRFGDGVASQLGAVLEEEGAERPFLIMDRGLDQFVPGVAAAIAPLDGAVRFEKDAGEPTVAVVEQAAETLAASGCDAVVALGGGSSMDTAKAARLVVGQGGPYLRFAAGGVAYEPPSIPLVCVPTTAGTGSEVSGGAVITDQETHIKAGIASPFLRAQHALVDATLTHGLPAKLTAYTGIDALAQAMAALVVTARTPVGDAIGLEGTRLAGGALVRAVRDGSDAGARSEMMCASLLGGLAMNISDCGSEHSIAQAIGGLLGLPHGLTIGLVLAETMDRDRRFVPEQFERIADALGEPDDGSGDGSRAVRAVRRILAELEFETLGSVGLGEDHLDELAENALADYFISVAPSPWSHDEVVAALRAGLAVGDSR